MRRRKLSLLIAVVLGVGSLASLAGADDMVLTKGGDLYQVTATPEGLVVEGTSADGAASPLLVPQTAAIVASSLQVGVDDESGAVYVVWQQGEGLLGTVRMAVYAEGAWLGPMTLAGGNGTAADSPQLLVFRHQTSLANEDGSTTVVGDTFLHLVWWGFATTEEDGSAFYAGIPIDEHGLPVFDDFAPRPVSDLLPFGIGCSAITNAAELAHPMLFVDPQSGNPHLLATDFGQCLFQVVELQVKPSSDEVTDKRRRRVVIFGRSKFMPVSRQLPLDRAKVAVGHDLSVVMYWEQQDRVDYVVLSRDGASNLRSLAVDEDLRHDRAVELIRTLTR